MHKGKNKGNFSKSKRKSPESVGIQGFSVAAGEGFEPSHTESESAVLPLHNPAKRKSYYNSFLQFVNSFFTLF